MSGAWLVSYVMLWVAVAVLGLAVVALARQIGVLHARVAPMGTHFAGEGPELDTPAPDVGLDWAVSPLTLVAFTSPTCTVCRELRPSLDALARQEPGLRLQTVDLSETTRPVFDAFTCARRPTWSSSNGAAPSSAEGWPTPSSRSRSWCARPVSTPSAAPADLPGE
jgi:thiol-disulfide isomerase/thioredoxin